MSSSSSATERAHKVFVAASDRRAEKRIAAEIDARGWQHRSLREFPVSSTSIAALARAAIETSDLIIVHIGKPTMVPLVAFELGVALAFEKPLILLTEPKAEIPTFAAGVLTIAMDSDRAVENALNLAKNILEQPKAQRDLERGTGPAITEPTKIKNGHAAPLADYVDPRNPENRKTFEEFLARALRHSGASVSVPRKSTGPDLIAAASDMDARVGNPVAIEIKKVRPGSLQNVIAQLQRLAKASSTRHVLLLAIDPLRDADVRRLPEEIIYADVVDFTTRVAADRFSEIVLSLWLTQKASQRR